MASRGLPASSKATASEVEQFSDATVWFLQLVHIFTDLVPKILLEVLTHHITKSEAFLELTKKPWEGDQSDRECLATMMENNPRVQGFSCQAVRRKPASEWDVTNLSAALSTVMEPSDVPCYNVDVTQKCSKKDDPIKYFNVYVPTSKTDESKYWPGFNINATGVASPVVVECVVTEVLSDTQIEVVFRVKAKDRDDDDNDDDDEAKDRDDDDNDDDDDDDNQLPKICQPVYFPLPEVGHIVKVRWSRNALYHRSKTEVSGEEFTQCVTSVRCLIEGALRPYFPKADSDGYLTELERAACPENFRDRFRDVKDLAELIQMLKHMKEDVQVLKELKERITALCSEMNGIHRRLQRQLEDIKAKVDKLENLLKDVQQGQEVIKHGQAVIQCKQDQHQVVTEQVLAVLQGLEPGQEYISHQLEPRGAEKIVSTKLCLLLNKLYEAYNDSLAIEKLYSIFPHQLKVDLCTSSDTAACVFALQHQPSIETLVLSCSTTGSVNLQLLLDALSHHPTARELYIECGYSALLHEKNRAALCQFWRGKHRLAKVELNELPVEVVIAALSTESSTMEEFKWDCDIPVDDDAKDNLEDCLRSTSLRCITIEGGVAKALLHILRGLAENTKTVDRTVRCNNSYSLDPPCVMYQLGELRQFLVPCVRCVLTVPLAVRVWGTLLSGVGDARQLERLRVDMRAKPRRASPEWDHIDQPTLEEVERSWAHSRCGKVEVNFSGCSYYEGMRRWRKFPIIQGSTLDATMKLLCAVVRGIIQREDQFVFKLEVDDEQVSRLVELEDIAKSKCSVTRTENVVEAENLMTRDFMESLITVLELKPLSSDRKGKSSSSQPPAKRSRQRL